MSNHLIINAHILTVDSAANEYPNGWVAIQDKRIVGVGSGEVPAEFKSFEITNGEGALLTPGFINTHHHLYQWATRGIATESTLFDWLVELYPIWGHIDADITFAAAQGALASLLLSGCTYTTDHHYLFPREGGDCLEAEIKAAEKLGIRFHPTRGSMDLGRSQGGLPPDHVVEDRDEILRVSEEAVHRFHDASDEAMVKIGIAPCSPFSVTGELMKEAATLARKLNVRLHTHLAETLDEEEFLTTVIKSLLCLCDSKIEKNDKSIIASNIMYIVGEFHIFVEKHWSFLRVVLSKLFDFILFNILDGRPVFNKSVS